MPVCLTQIELKHERCMAANDMSSCETTESLFIIRRRAILFRKHYSMVQWCVNRFTLMHIETTEDHINVLSMVHCYGALHPIFDQLKPHDPTQIFFFRSECFMELIPCDFESGGRICEAQNIVN